MTEVSMDATWSGASVNDEGRYCTFADQQLVWKWKKKACWSEVLATELSTLYFTVHELRFIQGKKETTDAEIKTQDMGTLVRHLKQIAIVLNPKNANF